MINDIDKSSITMAEWSCCNCGCVQWMPEELNLSLRKSHQTFYCLNGHSQYYSKKTDMEEMQNKLSNEYAKNAQLESKIKQLQKDVSDLSGIKESLKEISKKRSSIVKRIFK